MMLSGWLLFVFVAAALATMVGSAVGVFVAALLAVIPGRSREPRVGWDVALGALGFVGGLILCDLTPFPRNTVYEDLPTGGVVATTMSRYQHPYRLAFAASVLLPTAFEVWRSTRNRFSK